MSHPFTTIAPQTEASQWLRFGAIRPRGWIAHQMRHDLEHGFVGQLDQLVPSLISNDDIYISQRLSRVAKPKDLGVVAQDADWQIQYLWWNSETQSNWRDGLMRSALLLDHPSYLAKIQTYLEQILASQDDDGYLGIYGPDLRYQLTGENGELWAQASLFRWMLGYYEATNDARVFTAVQRAVECTMRAWQPGQVHPFAVPQPYAGVSHGLVFTDVLDRLSQLTGDRRYRDYAIWLYQEYSQSEGGEADIRYQHLIDPGYRFAGHGVHTYEHLRALVCASYATGNPALQTALHRYINKLQPCLTPSGGPIGDEWIWERDADVAETGYEYCSIHELLDSYSHLLQKSADPHWADQIEWIFFNAAQGARHPHESSIAYLKTDTSTAMVGTLHPDDPIDPAHPQTRYKYSPAHQDVAVCCVPNAGRIASYYLKSMWLRTNHGLFAALYGPAELHTELDGTSVTITSDTHYPLDLSITLSLELSQPHQFELALRIPSWATGWHCQINGETLAPSDTSIIRINRMWHTGSRIELRFEAQLALYPEPQHQLSLRYGPLLYVRPIEATAHQIKQHPLPGFHDLHYTPVETNPNYRLAGTAADIRWEPGQPTASHPWAEPPALIVPMVDPEGNPCDVRCLPIGCTILRQASFAKG